MTVAYPRGPGCWSEAVAVLPRPMAAPRVSSRVRMAVVALRGQAVVVMSRVLTVAVVVRTLAKSSLSSNSQERTVTYLIQGGLDVSSLRLYSGGMMNTTAKKPETY